MYRKFFKVILKTKSLSKMKFFKFQNSFLVPIKTKKIMFSREYHVSGVGSVEAEVLCPPGAFPTNSTNCEPCPIGTYNPFEDARNGDFCMECRAGSYNNQTGTFLMFC